MCWKLCHALHTHLHTVWLTLVSFFFFFFFLEKAMAPHSSTLAWKIPWMEEPGGLQSIESLRVGHDWATSPSLFTFMRWRRKWQPTPVFLPGESQGRGSLMGCHLWGRILGFANGSEGKHSAWNIGDLVRYLSREDPLGKEWQPSPVFLPGEFHLLHTRAIWAGRGKLY